MAGLTSLFEFEFDIVPVMQEMTNSTPVNPTMISSAFNLLLGRSSTFENARHESTCEFCDT